MVIVIADRVKETTSTTGTGTYSLSGTSVGFRTFVAGVGNGNQTYYVCEDGTSWETGLGTITDATPDTLARTVVLASSNSGAAVNWGVGTRNIFCSYPAAGLLLSANNLSDVLNVGTTKQNLGLVPSGQSGGADGKIVRVSAANTWVDAAQSDSVDQLVGLMFKSGGLYYGPGSFINGFSSLTTGAVYYLSTSGSITSTAPTPSSTVRRVVVGKAVSTTSLLFTPMTPVGG